MTEFIDISVPVDGDLPTWLDGPRPEFTPLLAIARGDHANATQIKADLHTGTHIDAPLHFVADGKDVEAVGLRPLVGSAAVAETPATSIGAPELDALDIPAGTRRLLLRTQNTARGLLRQRAFAHDACALTETGAQWAVDRGLELIGIDYLSIQHPEDGPEVHQILLRAGVIILEGIDLSEAPPGQYDLVCLPTRLAGPEAAPARAILLTSGTL